METFSIDSFVRLFSGLLITTWPIGLDNAKDLEDFGSAFGLSRFNWGYRNCTGWEKLDSWKGETVGELELLIKNNW